MFSFLYIYKYIYVYTGVQTLFFIEQHHFLKYVLFIIFFHFLGGCKSFKTKTNISSLFFKKNKRNIFPIIINKYIYNKITHKIFQHKTHPNKKLNIIVWTIKFITKKRMNLFMILPSHSFPAVIIMMIVILTIAISWRMIVTTYVPKTKMTYHNVVRE